MNRCIHRSFWRSCVALLVAAPLGLMHVNVLAQSNASNEMAQPAVRAFPAKALRAALVVTQPPEILIDGKPERLSPGARIRGANNMMVMSGALVGQQYLVHFVREPMGLVHEVWILTEAEARIAHTLATPRAY